MKRPRSPACGACSRVCLRGGASAWAHPACRWKWTDPDGDDDRRSAWGGSGGGRFDGPRGPWWRPASTAGRVFLGLAALAVLGGLATGVFYLKTYLERDARFRIAGSEQHRGHRADRSEPRRDAAGLRRRHRAQHLLCSFGRAAQAIGSDSLGGAGHGDAPAPGPDSRAGGGAAAGGLCARRASRSAWWTPTGFCSPCRRRRWPSTTTRSRW